MASEISIRRRAFLGDAAALGAMHGFRMPTHAVVSPSVSNLPARSNVVIRNAYYPNSRCDLAIRPHSHTSLASATGARVCAWRYNSTTLLVLGRIWIVAGLGAIVVPLGVLWIMVMKPT